MNRQIAAVPRVTRRAALVAAAKALALIAAGCGAVRVPQGPTPGPTAPSEAPVTSLPTDLPPTAAPTYTPATTPLVAQPQGPGCPGSLKAVVAPTPIPYPGYTQIEPSTKLHVTAPPQTVDVETYRLKVTGKVLHELALAYDELRCLPKVSSYSRIECPGFFVDWSNLAGASLASVIALAGPLESAQRVEFRGVDGRTSSCPLIEAQGTDYFLAYEWEGEALPISHGFPVRAALTNNSGGSWVKWLMEINVV